MTDDKRFIFVRKKNPILNEMENYIEDNGNTILKITVYSDCEDIVDVLNDLDDENQQLKSKYSEQCIQLDFLKAENKHMKEVLDENKELRAYNKEMVKDIKDLEKRNERQAKQLDRLYKLIEVKDWRSLSDIIDDFQRCEEQLKSEWRQY
ncbi:hypothetical protein [Methanobrevibacter sp.]